MIVLGIETSCDETAIAVLKHKGKRDYQILSEKISSQVNTHRPYGGVVPELASREHMKNLPILCTEALSEANLQFRDIDLLAVTEGPGLKGCLLMGICFTEGVSAATGIPSIGVHHIEGHILAPLLDYPELDFPYLCLVVSGGHTEVHVVNGVGEYQCLGRTMDDAAGEAFDKSAHLLGYSYPGGPILARMADQAGRGEESFVLPPVMQESPQFSFSGLKTAIALQVRNHSDTIESDEQFQSRAAWSIQDAILGTLEEKVRRFLKETKLKQLVVTGGVSANQELRKRFSALLGVTTYFPQQNHCMDNAAMIAFTGAERVSAGDSTDRAIEVQSRYPVENLLVPGISS